MTDTEALLNAKLNSETARIDWPELQRHYARGSIIKVAADMDLVAVAQAIAQDDRHAVAAWLDAGKIARATDEDVISWHARAARFWAVVTAPWVLVQEIVQ